MGILHPDQRDYPATQGVPVTSGALPAQQQPVAQSHFGGNRHAAGQPPTIPVTQTTATGPAPNTAGPHKYDILNKLDPSVDSDMSKAQHHQHHQNHHMSPALAAGVGAGAGAGMMHHHDQQHPGHGHHHREDTGAAYGVATHQQQAIPVANTMAATGHAHNTAGPHSSDMMNRLDPTVDSQTGLRK